MSCQFAASVRILAFLSTFVIATCAADAAEQKPVRELKVHLAQANSQSNYAFVRATFEPGELADPYAVRFVDDRGQEVPYFVWDSITWQVAREGRDDWGHQYALINHAPGNSAYNTLARAAKIELAKKNWPELGKKLEAEDQAALKNPDSQCAVMYLLRHSVPAMAKERLTMRIFADRQIEPSQKSLTGAKQGGTFTAASAELQFKGLPDKLSVAWKGRELFHSAGFDTGGNANATSHADPEKPFSIDISEGIVTRVRITSQTLWRKDGAMDWQCTYWLFPEGGYVALEGFSLSNPGQYLGGPQKLSIFASPAGAFAESHKPDWDKPWWIHQAGDHDFVATHLFMGTPLTIGFGNNPFAINDEGPNKEPRAEVADGKLALRWVHELNDPAISRLMSRSTVAIKNGHIAAAEGAPDAAKLQWQPNIDWLYRQYIVGVGEKADEAEAALRQPLCAAAGWIDRPFTEEEIAKQLVSHASHIGVMGQSAEINLLKVVPAIMRDDHAAISQAMNDRLNDVVARTDQYIAAMKANAANGGHPAAGSKQLPNGERVEGWTGNPCYHAALMPAQVRVLEFFDQKFNRDASEQAITRYADFGLELLGGTPFDLEKMRKNLESQWPSRVVPTIPLMLHAHSIKADEKYGQAAKMLFDDLFALVKRNPHGYFPAWTFTPGADRFDTVYNPVSYDRGISSVWYEGAQDRVGRDKTSAFAAAQARWLVYSGQLLDTLEMDNVCAIRTCNHGAHTNLRNQISVYLYDDFAFYRGLVGDLIAWSSAADFAERGVDRSGTGPYRSLIVSDAGSPMVRWAFGIRPDNKWLESKVDAKPETKGFKAQAWNRLPLAKPIVAVKANQIGLPGDATVMEVQLLEPAYREPVEIELTPLASESIQLQISKPVVLKLSIKAIKPNWPDRAPTVEIRRLEQTVDILRIGVTYENGELRWDQMPAGYFKDHPLTVVIRPPAR